MFIFYTLASSVLYVAGDVLGKIWALKNDPKIFVIGIILYTIGGVFSFYAIREASLSLALLVIPPLAIILSLSIGYFAFGEKLSQTQYLAAVIILLGLGLLLWDPKIVD